MYYSIEADGERGLRVWTKQSWRTDKSLYSLGGRLLDD
jgi:hypothetical protein